MLTTTKIRTSRENDDVDNRLIFIDETKTMTKCK